MKKCLLFGLWLLVLPIFLTAQTCLPAGINFTTQAQIDDFRLLYPGCTEIMGDVCIGNCSGTGYTTAITNVDSLVDVYTVNGDLEIRYNSALEDVDGFAALGTIGGSLMILNNPNIEYLNGLENIATVGENVLIQYNSSLLTLGFLQSIVEVPNDCRIIGNISLPNLFGLNSLEKTGGQLFIGGCHLITDLDELSSLDSVGTLLGFSENFDLADISGLNDLEHIGNYLSFSRSNLITNFSDLGGMTGFTGRIALFDMDGLTDLTDFEDINFSMEGISIEECDALTNLWGFENISRVRGDVKIRDNNALLSLSALENIDSIYGYFWVDENAALTTIGLLDPLVYIEEDLKIENNPSLERIDGFNTLDYVGEEIYISQNYALEELSGFNGLVSIANPDHPFSSDLLIFDIAEDSITGFSSLEHIDGDLRIGSSVNLKGTQGFSSLISVGYELRISTNHELENLQGFESLTTVGGLNILQNNQLASLNGLEALATSTRNVSLSSCPLLTDISALSNLTDLGGFSIILSSLPVSDISGLENIDPTTIGQLRLQNNANLSACALDNFCTYLADPAALATISSNVTNCNTRAEIEAMCLALPVEWLSFTGQRENNRNRLRWETVREEHNRGFYVERSLDGRQWVEIGFVAATETGVAGSRYTFFDQFFQMGSNHYRLRQQDLDGSTYYSSIVEIEVERGENKPGFYPNPASDHLNLIIPGNQPVQVVIYNALGQQVYQSTLCGHDRIEVADWPAGAYWLRWAGESSSTVFLKE